MDPVIDAVLRGALALLFLLAASHKARDLGAFRETLLDYRLLPAGTAAAAARVIVGAELAAAAALLAPGPRIPGPLLTALLLGVYTSAIAINLARGRRDVDCGCTGPALRQPLRGALLARNTMLLAGALACLAPVHPRPLVWVDALTIVAAVSVLVMFYATLDRMLANAPRLASLQERS
jgi:hypothetical protein